MKNFYILFLICILFSCKNKSSYTNSGNEEAYSDYGYEDGDYCAEIQYYYSKTGTQSVYTLKVEIENNQLVKIYWPNGGWLDETHFTTPEISDGEASFESDQGVEYSVRIIGNAYDCSYSNSAESEEDMVQKVKEKEEAETCPKCGSTKYSYDEYCTSCTDELENICSRCGGYEYYVNGGLCHNCKEDEESNDE